jgi:hypothetical protein
LCRYSMTSIDIIAPSKPPQAVDGKVQSLSTKSVMEV